jgi:hypothetical protein
VFLCPAKSVCYFCYLPKNRAVETGDYVQPSVRALPAIDLRRFANRRRGGPLWDIWGKSDVTLAATIEGFEASAVTSRADSKAERYPLSVGNSSTTVSIRKPNRALRIRKEREGTKLAMRRKRESLAESWLVGARQLSLSLYKAPKPPNRGTWRLEKMMRKAAAQGTVRQCNQGE